MRPTLLVEIALATKPSEAPAWVDVSAYVRTVPTITRGRQQELDQVQCGTAELVLDNRDRRFDPFYVDGPYYGQLLPMRRVRIGAAIPDVANIPEAQTFGIVGDMPGHPTYWHLFSGYVEEWDPETYANGSRDSTVTVRLVDGFEPLARAQLTEDYPEQLSGARIAQALTDANWTTGTSWVVGSAVNGRVGTMVVGPAGDRALADGVSTIVAQKLENIAALQHCLDIAGAEGGWFFMSKAGVATFYDRHRLLRTAFRTERCSFGSYVDEDDVLDDGLDYTSVTYSYGCEWIYNDVAMQAIDGAEQRVIDSTSQGKYFRRTLQESNLPLASDSEALSRARFLLGRYKEPQVRLDTLIFEGAIPWATWAALLALEIGDMIRVKHLPPGGAGTAFWSQNSIIQGVSHDITESSWKVTMWLAPHHTGGYWIVGESKVGAADMRPAW